MTATTPRYMMTPRARLEDVETRMTALEATLGRNPATRQPGSGDPEKSRLTALEVRLEALEGAAEGYAPPEGSQPLVTWIARSNRPRLENLESRVAAFEAHVEG